MYITYKNKRQKMNYTSEINDSEEGLKMVLDAVGRFCPDNFLYAVRYKNWTEENFFEELFV